VEYQYIVLAMVTLLTCVFVKPLKADTDARDTTGLAAALAEITSDKRITLFNTDSSRVIGRLVSVDFEQSLLSIHEQYRSDRGYTTYSFAQLNKITFRKKGHLKPGWMLLGLVAGSAAGYAIGYSVDDDFLQPIVMGMGVCILGAGGFLAGTLIPVITSSEMVEYRFNGGDE